MIAELVGLSLSEKRHWRPTDLTRPSIPKVLGSMERDR